MRGFREGRDCNIDSECLAYPLALIVSMQSFENVLNLLKISLMSLAIEIKVRMDRETWLSKD